MLHKSKAMNFQSKPCFCSKYLFLIYLLNAYKLRIIHSMYFKKTNFYSYSFPYQIHYIIPIYPNVSSSLKFHFSANQCVFALFSCVFALSIDF